MDDFVFNFCFDDLLTTTPVPNDEHPPVWLCMSGCGAYDASIQVLMMVIESAPMVNLICRVPFRYCSTLRSLPQSSMAGLATLVVRKEIAINISGRPRFATNRSFATQLWKILCFFVLSASRPSVISNQWALAGVAAGDPISSSKSSSVSSIYSMLWISTFFSFNCYIHAYVRMFMSLCHC